MKDLGPGTWTRCVANGSGTAGELDRDDGLLRIMKDATLRLGAYAREGVRCLSCAAAAAAAAPVALCSTGDPQGNVSDRAGEWVNERDKGAKPTTM